MTRSFLSEGALWLSAAVLTGMVACVPEAPNPGEMFTRVTIFPAATGPPTPGVLALENLLIREIETAEVSVDLALATFHSTAVVDALVAARDRGIAVRLVGDEDNADDPGFAAARAAGLSLTLGDGPILWSPTPTVQIQRSGDTNQMTHSFLVVDRLRMIVLTSGLPDPTDFLQQTVLRLESEDFGKDYGDVFDQMHGGTFATSLTAFGALTSANPNNRTRYVGDQRYVLETYYGPAQPLVKQYIDQTYAARASVYLATPLLANEELVSALRYKAEAGFDVRLVVQRDAFRSTFSLAPALDALFAQVRERNGTDFPSLTVVERVPESWAIFDAAPSPLTSEVFDRIAVWSSHAMLPGLPYVVDEFGVSPRPAGLFTDGNLWLIREQPAHVAVPINEALARFGRLLESR